MRPSYAKASVGGQEAGLECEELGVLEALDDCIDRSDRCHGTTASRTGLRGDGDRPAEPTAENREEVGTFLRSPTVRE